MGQIDLWGNETEDEKVLTYTEKIEQAKDVLRLAAEISWDYYQEPLIITYSGGKDSDYRRFGNTFEYGYKNGT